MYEVHTHRFGLRGMPTHQWTKVTSRPLGLVAAKEVADAMPVHAVVTPWQQAGAVYDNGKQPGTLKRRA